MLNLANSIQEMNQNFKGLGLIGDALNTTLMTIWIARQILNT